MDDEIMDDWCCALCRHADDVVEDELTCYCNLLEQEKAIDETCNKFEY